MDKKIENFIKERTLFCKRKMQNIINNYNSLMDDPKKESRIQRQLCKPCYYSTRFAGQGFTNSKCHICEEEIINSTTDINYVCQECAIKYDICIKCGSYINCEIGGK